MPEFKAISIDGDDFYIVASWANKLASFICGYNIYGIPVDSNYNLVTEWMKKHVVITENKNWFYSWYTEGLYTHGDDGIVRFLSDLNVAHRREVKRKTYGVEASAIIETSEKIPDFVIEHLENIILQFFENYTFWSKSEIKPVNLRKVKFAEDTSAFFDPK